MAKVARRVVASHDGDDGTYYEVACAVRADGTTSPVATFLDDLEAGKWEPEERDQQATPDEQIKAREWFLSACKMFAETGDLPHRPVSHNQLWDGIWEIKHHDMRVTFYDHDGQGGCDPKIDRIGQSAFRPPPLPEFDPLVRLATAFAKDSQKTPQPHIDEALDVREEDLNHDRP